MINSNKSCIEMACSDAKESEKPVINSNKSCIEMRIELWTYGLKGRDKQ